MWLRKLLVLGFPFPRYIFQNSFLSSISSFGLPTSEIWLTPIVDTKQSLTLNEYSDHMVEVTGTQSPHYRHIVSDLINARTKGSHFIPSQCLSAWIQNIRLGINDTVGRRWFESHFPFMLSLGFFHGWCTAGVLRSRSHALPLTTYKCDISWSECTCIVSTCNRLKNVAIYFFA